MKTSIKVEFIPMGFNAETEQVEFIAGVTGSAGTRRFEYSGGIRAFTDNAALAKLGLSLKGRAAVGSRAHDIFDKIMAGQVKAKANAMVTEVCSVFDQIAKLAKPTSEDLIACLIRDSEDTDGSFEDWASNCGYDSDSIKALGIFDKCRETHKKLREILSDEQWTEACEIRDAN